MEGSNAPYSDDIFSWFKGKIKLNGRPLDLATFYSLFGKHNGGFTIYSGNIGYSFKYDLIQTPEEIKEEKKNYNLGYYDDFAKLNKNTALLFDSINESGIFNMEKYKTILDSNESGASIIFTMKIQVMIM